MRLLIWSGIFIVRLRIWPGNCGSRLPAFAPMTVTALYVTERCSTFQQFKLLDSTAQACGQRQEQLEEAVDAIRQKYGRTAIAFGNGEEGEALPEEEL